jgi:hypothetical protein
MCHGLGGRATCASELASKYAEVRFISAIIVMRGWIMHARQFVTVGTLKQRYPLLQCEDAIETPQVLPKALAQGQHS